MSLFWFSVWLTFVIFSGEMRKRPKQLRNLRQPYTLTLSPGYRITLIDRLHLARRDEALCTVYIFLHTNLISKENPDPNAISFLLIIVQVIQSSSSHAFAVPWNRRACSPGTGNS